MERLENTFLCKITLMKRIISYLKEVKLELSKVIWPKREEVIKLTVTVLLISVIVGAYVGGLDFAYTKALEYFIIR